MGVLVGKEMLRGVLIRCIDEVCADRVYGESVLRIGCVDGVCG